MPGIPLTAGSDEESKDETGSTSVRGSDQVRSRGAHGQDSAKPRTAKRRKIVDTTRSSPDPKEDSAGRLSVTPSVHLRPWQEGGR